LRELERSVEVLRSMFPGKSDSWVRRCVRRLGTVRRISRDVWFLRCVPELGDRRAYYLVKFNRETGRYECSCYDSLSPWGDRRRKEVCTHVGAVILSRLVKQARVEVAAGGRRRARR